MIVSCILVRIYFFILLGWHWTNIHLPLVTRRAVPSKIIWGWRPQAVTTSQRVASSGLFEADGNAHESDEESGSTSDSDSSSEYNPPPISNLLARRGGLRNIAEESEVEQEVINISGRTFCVTFSLLTFLHIPR